MAKFILSCAALLFVVGLVSAGGSRSQRSDDKSKSESWEKVEYPYKKLTKSLLENYAQEGILGLPSRRSYEPVRVNARLFAFYFWPVSGTTNQIFGEASLLLKWRDHNLKWHPKEYGGLETITVPVNSIWHPRISVWSDPIGSIDYFFSDAERSDARVYADGFVAWYPNIHFTTICNPLSGNKLNCTITLGDLTLVAQELDLFFDKHYKNVDTTYLTVSPTIVSSYGYKQYFKENFPTRHSVYSTLNYNVVFQL